MDYCLYEIPDAENDGADDVTSPQPRRPRPYDQEAAETAPLLSRVLTGARPEAHMLPGSSPSRKAKLENSLARITNDGEGAIDDDDDGDPTSAFRGLNALEIAAVADAKRFLSQHPVQRIVSGIWNGDIIFWDSLSVHTTKRHTFYDPETSDPFSRLRVPKYLKSWEVLFFAIFLCLYYAVLVARVETHISATEITLFIWIAAFAYDEWSKWIDAGSIFYATDIWNLFDMTMILIGFVFATLRKFASKPLALFMCSAHLARRNRWPGSWRPQNHRPCL